MTEYLYRTSEFSGLKTEKQTRSHETDQEVGENL